MQLKNLSDEVALLLPEDAEEMLDGERIAKGDQDAARDGIAPPDRLLESLLGVLLLDGVQVPATVRLRAWCRTHQKALEGIGS